MQKQAISVNPALLRWARCSAGLSVQEAVLRAKIGALSQRKNNDAVTAEERLISWERGLATPSLSQLKALASAYRRPLVTFFLPRPPRSADQVMDYRTVRNRAHESPEFAALKRRVFLLHRELSAIAQDEGAKALNFVGSCTMQGGISATVEAIRQTLDIFSCVIHPSNTVFSFRSLRERIQKAGIYVLLMGDLASFHSRVRPDEFRGIAIADYFVPIIVINPYDTHGVMTFTLLQELAHIFLGYSGISNQDVFGSEPLHESIEQFCNAVAAEFLVPEEILRPVWRDQCGSLDDCSEHLRRYFGVSREVIVRRLFDLKLIEESDYKHFIKIFRSRWRLNNKKHKDQNRDSNASILSRNNLGKKTVEMLLRAIENGQISLLEAARAVNVSVCQFEEAVR